MPGNTQRERLAATMQPTCLDEERQTANVISVSVGDPDCVQVRKSKAKLQELSAARLARIQEHPLASSFKQNARLKASGDDVTGTSSEKSYRGHGS
jgi:hypothetical protein